MPFLTDPIVRDLAVRNLTVKALVVIDLFERPLVSFRLKVGRL